MFGEGITGVGITVSGNTSGVEGVRSGVIRSVLGVVMGAVSGVVSGVGIMGVGTMFEVFSGDLVLLDEGFIMPLPTQEESKAQIETTTRIVGSNFFIVNSF